MNFYHDNLHLQIYFFLSSSFISFLSFSSLHFLFFPFSLATGQHFTEGLNSNLYSSLELKPLEPSLYSYTNMRRDGQEEEIEEKRIIFSADNQTKTYLTSWESFISDVAVQYIDTRMNIAQDIVSGSKNYEGFRK